MLHRALRVPAFSIVSVSGIEAERDALLQREQARLAAALEQVLAGLTVDEEQIKRDIAAAIAKDPIASEFVSKVVVPLRPLFKNRLQARFSPPLVAAFTKLEWRGDVDKRRCLPQKWAAVKHYD